MTSSTSLLISTLLVPALLGLPRPTLPQDPSPGSPHLPTSAARPAGLIPRAVTSFGAAHLGGFAYTLGGYFGMPHDYHDQGQSAAFQRFSLLDGSWEDLPSPGAMQSVALVSHGNALFRSGGMVILNGPGEDARLESRDTFARFDLDLREWSELPPLPEPRSSHMAAVLDGSLYVAGGWQLFPDDRESVWRDTLLRYDLSQEEGGRWESFAAPFRRRALGVAAIRGHIVVVGGIDPEGSVSSSVNVFRPEESDPWSKGPDYPESAFGISIVGVGDRVYGSAGDGVVHSWAPGENAWRAETSWIFPRFFHQIVPGRAGEIVALGGVARGGRVRHVEAMNLTDGEARTVTHRWSVPAPGLAIGGQILNLTGNELYAFGGFDREGAAVQDCHRLDLLSMNWERRSPLPMGLVNASTSKAVRTQAHLGLFSSGAEATGARTAGLAYDYKYDSWEAQEYVGVDTVSEGRTAQHGEDTWLFASEGLLLREADSTRFETTDLHLPTVRRNFAVAADDDLAVLVGGVDADGEALQHCDVFRFSDRSWSRLPAPKGVRHAPQAVFSGGRLVVLGGLQSDSAQPWMEVFDFGESTWQPLRLDEIEKASASLLTFGDRLLVHSPRADTAAVDLVLIDLGLWQVAERDVAGHFRR